MTIKSLESKPYTTYHYHIGLHTEVCSECKNDLPHNLLRYRTYFMMKYPLIPTRNTYYLVCTNCGHYDEIENERFLINLLYKSKGQSPFKYNKYSILELEHYVPERIIPDEFKYNVLTHLKDLKGRS